MKNNQFVFPDFNHSIVNLAATMSQFLGKPSAHPTLPKLLERLKPEYKNIVYLVIDGMGTRILEKNLPTTSFLRKNQIDTITSVFPSTTATATTSLTSALTPAEHGWFAWTVDFNGEIIELFLNRNFYTHELTPDRNFTKHTLPYKNFFEDKNLKREIYSCFGADLCSKIHAEHEIEYHSLGQMFRCLHQICNQPDPKFIYGYYPKLDAYLHDYGTKARRSRHLLKTIQHKIVHLAKKHPDTIFVITADHGQTDVQGFTYICDDTEIQACLAHPISLESRSACFKLKPGKDADFRAAFQKYTDDYTLYSSQDLIKQGLFGDFKLHPEYQKYLGDYIAIGGSSAKMMIFKHGDEYHSRKHLYHGVHTGLTADEMEVPVIVVAGDQLQHRRGIKNA